MNFREFPRSNLNLYEEKNIDGLIKFILALSYLAKIKYTKL